MKKGKSGQQIAVENVALVKAWIEERTKLRDWSEYAFNNRINRRVIAEELDFATSVCTQNKSVRDLLETADGLWFKSDGVDRAAHEASRQRAEVQSSYLSSNNNELRQRITELEVENRQLRRELDAFRRQQALVERGAPGFKL
jgi:hypothetical protein